MPSPTVNVSRRIAEGVKDLLNAETFSLPFQAERSWKTISTSEDLERPTVLVIPAQRDRSPLTMGGKAEHLVAVDVTVERMLGGQTGELDREDELADLAQEVEDFLSNPDNKVVAGGIRATPMSTSIEWDREALTTERVMRTLISINYRLAR